MDYYIRLELEAIGDLILADILDNNQKKDKEMNNNIEYDQRIRTKNLELTKTLQIVDKLTTELIILKEKNKSLQQQLDVRNEQLVQEIIDVNGNKVVGK
tara:strand:+ start:395 stop:691 length:297 start_codon:yes stop_codon:yes gene_type:complete